MYGELFILLDDAHNYYQFDVVRSVPLLTRLTQEVPEDFPLQSSWYKYLGDILSRTGKQEEALQAYDEAERLYRKENVNLGLANVLLCRGDLKFYSGNTLAAKKYYEKSLPLYRQEQDVESVCETLSLIMVCCKLLDNEEFETYKHELRELLSTLPAYVLRNIAMRLPKK